MKLLEILDEPIKNKDDFLFEADFLYEEVNGAVDEIPLGRGGRASISPIELEGRTFQRLIVIPDGTDFDPNNAIIRDFDRLDDAKAARTAFQNGNQRAFQRAIGRGTEVDPRRFSNQLDNFLARARAEGFEAASRSRPTVARLIGTGIFKYIFRLLVPAGIIFDEVWTTAAAIDIVNEDQNLSTAEKNELVSILKNVALTKIGVLTLWLVARVALLRQIIGVLRRVMAAGSIAAAIPTGGSSFLALIFGNIALVVVEVILDRPGVKIAFAEWLAGTIYAQAFEASADVVSGALAVLDQLTGGLLGSDDIRQRLWPEAVNPDAGVQGEVVASSEWAKLVFQDIIFPPDMERLLVPYIPQEQRAQLLRQAFTRDGYSLTTDDTRQPDTPTDTDDEFTPPTDQPAPDTDDEFTPPTDDRTPPPIPDQPRPS